jgi:hypothetical protein
LVIDANGDLFGTTYDGGLVGSSQNEGENGYGTVFELVNTGSGYTEKILPASRVLAVSEPVMGLNPLAP